MEARLALEAAAEDKAAAGGAAVGGSSSDPQAASAEASTVDAEAEADAPLRALLAEVNRVEAEVCAGLAMAFDGVAGGDGEGVATMASAGEGSRGGGAEEGGDDADAAVDVDAATLGTARLQYLQRLRREIRERMDE